MWQTKSGGRSRRWVKNGCENRASRNSPNFAVALTRGMGSSSLKADVKAFDRLQIVRDRNSSYRGPKYRSCSVRARCFVQLSQLGHKTLSIERTREKHRSQLLVKHASQTLRGEYFSIGNPTGVGEGPHVNTQLRRDPQLLVQECSLPSGNPIFDSIFKVLCAFACFECGLLRR